MSNDNRVKRDQLRVFEARQVLFAAKKKRTRRDQWVWVGAAVGATVLSSLALFGYSTIGPGQPAQVPNASLSESREWTGELVLGDVVMGVTVDGELAPQASANFISLAQEGFYDGTVCHRLTTEGIFVLQCGDPLGAGFGGPGYSFGPVENAPSDDTYPRGTLAMARTPNDAGSQGSQFFIVYEDSVIPRDLAGGYTVFGTVTSGLDAMVETFVAPGTEDGQPDGRPAIEPSIARITIR